MKKYSQVSQKQLVRSVRRKNMQNGTGVYGLLPAACLVVCDHSMILQHASTALVYNRLTTDYLKLCWKTNQAGSSKSSSSQFLAVPRGTAGCHGVVGLGLSCLLSTLGSLSGIFVSFP